MVLDNASLKQDIKEAIKIISNYDEDKTIVFKTGEKDFRTVTDTNLFNMVYKLLPEDYKKTHKKIKFKRTQRFSCGLKIQIDDAKTRQYLLSKKKYNMKINEKQTVDFNILPYVDLTKCVGVHFRNLGLTDDGEISKVVSLFGEVKCVKSFYSDEEICKGDVTVYYTSIKPSILMEKYLDCGDSSVQIKFFHQSISCTKCGRIGHPSRLCPLTEDCANEEKKKQQNYLNKLNNIQTSAANIVSEQKKLTAPAVEKESTNAPNVVPKNPPKQPLKKMKTHPCHLFQFGWCKKKDEECNFIHEKTPEYLKLAENYKITNPYFFIKNKPEPTPAEAIEIEKIKKAEAEIKVANRINQKKAIAEQKKKENEEKRKAEVEKNNTVFQTCNLPPNLAIPKTPTVIPKTITPKNITNPVIPKVDRTTPQVASKSGNVIPTKHPNLKLKFPGFHSSKTPNYLGKTIVSTMINFKKRLSPNKNNELITVQSSESENSEKNSKSDESDPSQNIVPYNNDSSEIGAHGFPNRLSNPQKQQRITNDPIDALSFGSQDNVEQDVINNAFGHSDTTLLITDNQTSPEIGDGSDEYNSALDLPDFFFNSSSEKKRSIPKKLIESFIDVSRKNHEKGLETLALIFQDLQNKKIHLFFPDQRVTETTCEATKVGDLQLGEFIDEHPELKLLAWIHDHASFNSFMSTHDLHMASSLGLLLPKGEFYSIVTDFNNNFKIFELTEIGSSELKHCPEKEHTHVNPENLYVCNLNYEVTNEDCIIYDFRKNDISSESSENQENSDISDDDLTEKEK